MRLSNSNRLFMAFIILFTALHAFGQSGDKFDFIPSSPNATALGEYGSHPVDLSNGVVNVNIPIYEFKAGDISIPISISHRTTGLKVDQTESWTGLGWELNAGGVITRTIFDEADEESVLQNEFYPYPENMSMGDYEALQFIAKDVDNPFFDSQVDEFSYNFSGYTGKFVFDRGGIPRFLPKTNLLIEKSINGLGRGEIILTTPNGVQYFFGGEYEEVSYMESAGANCTRNFDRRRVTSWYLYKVASPSGSTIHLEYTPSSYFYTYAFSQSKSKVTESFDSCTDNNGCSEPHPGGPCRSVFSMDEGQVLSRIYSEGIGEVEFDFGTVGSSRLALLNNLYVKSEGGVVKKHFSFEYDPISPTAFPNPDFSDPLPRHFLTFFAENNTLNGDVIAVHRFDYLDKDNVAPRLSYARDHWGYFNGADNNSLLPQTDNETFLGDPSATADRSPNFEYAVRGALSSITYPTGGKTLFYYEPNYVKKNSSEGKEIRTDLVLQGELNEIVTDRFLSAKFQKVAVGAFIHSTGLDPQTIKPTTFKIIEEGTNEELFKSVAPVIIDGSLEGNPDPEGEESSNMGYEDYIYVDNENEVELNKNKKYTVEIKSGGGTDVRPRLSLSYVSDVQYELTPTSFNTEAGGIRIKKIVEDPGYGDAPIIKKYNYNYFGSSRTSAETNYTPLYTSRNTTKGACFAGGDFDGVVTEYSCTIETLHSNSVLALANNSGSHITYKNVTILYGENAEGGKEEVTFRTMEDSPGRIVYGDDIPGSPHSNGWGNGLEVKREIFENKGGSFILKRRVSHEYASDDSAFDNIKSIVVRNTNSGFKEQRTFYCDESNIGEVVERETCVKEHNHFYVSRLFSKGWTCINGNMQTDTVAFHPCFGQPEDTTIVNFDYYDDIDILEYHRRSYWFYDSLKTEEFYDEFGNVLTIQHDYEYDNPEHRQLSRYTRTKSDGSQTTEYHYYPHDYSENLSEYNIRGLKEANFIVPIKTIKTVDGQLISGGVTTYNDKGQPLNHYTYSNSNLIPDTAHDPNVYLPSSFYELSNQWQYSANGSLEQVQKNEGSKFTSFIWGFDGKYPVAKLENTRADQLDALGIDLTPSGNLPSGSIDALKNLPKKSIITIYKYDPIYGLIQIIDPNGSRTNYKYDELGRLKEIVEVTDSGENILKTFSYRYNSN